MAKKTLRKQILSTLRRADTADLQAQSALISQSLFNHPKYIRSKSVCVYVSTAYEVDTFSILRNIFKNNKLCYVPHFESETNFMDMVQVNNFEEVVDLPEGLWAIKQPSNIDGRETALKHGHLELIIVPGVAFAKDGRRLGRGKGFYDRFLQRYASQFHQRPYAIGLAFGQQIVHELPVEDGDELVDCVLHCPKRQKIANVNFCEFSKKTNAHLQLKGKFLQPDYLVYGTFGYFVSLPLEETMESAEQKYSATLFWNDVLRAFRSRMPVKNHRRNFKVYASSFTGREAVDWLHGYLSAKLQQGRSVNREQSVGLFRKFHEVKLFHAIGPKAKSSEFCSSALFTFSNVSVTAITRTPLACKNQQTKIELPPANELPEGKKRRRPTFRQLMFKGHHQESSGASDTQVASETTTICQAEPVLQLREVGRREFEMLWKHCCVESLRQYFGTNELLSVFDLSNVDASHIVYNAVNFTSRGIAKVPNAADDIPGWILRSMKCLANWPWLNGVLNTTCYVGFERDIFNTMYEFFNSPTCAGAFLPSSFVQFFFAILDHAESLDAKFSMEARNCPFSRTSVSMANDSTCRSALDPKEADLVVKRRAADVSDEFSECPRDIGETSAHFGELSFTQRAQMLNEMPGLVQSPKLLAQVHHISRGELFDGQRGRLFNPRASFSCTAHSQQQQQQQADESLASNLRKARLRSSIVMCPQVHSPMLSYFGQRALCAPRVATFQSLRVRQMTLDALSIALLMLPPKNRRWMQLLLRFVDRVSSNYCLKLDKFKSISNRALMINAFSSCLVASSPSLLQNDTVRLFSCLLDLQAEIFKPPSNLENSVKTKLAQLRCSPPSNVYCERVTADEYDRQKMEHSMEAIMNLLDEIVQNDQMSREEKTKHLKAFQTTYPLLYQRRFPNDPLKDKQESLLEQLKEKLGFKQTRL